ncbi:hypothetical protein AQUCO_00700695v1 [Aquilegia coerulea]|uniref:KIB1-4 beta-propeller domain-containing protein n=1 Tax=Aquilegia coerulea TaxID=218851 RepID=A0A2G5ELB7_AQUCA|nr:hypothetical protein AQUCO_00700695v1 [Aquilegia coerulea]
MGCFTGLVENLLPILCIPSIRDDTKKTRIFNFICNALPIVFNSIQKGLRPIWSGIVVFLVCEFTITLVIWWCFRKPAEDDKRLLVVHLDCKEEASLISSSSPSPGHQPHHILSQTTDNSILPISALDHHKKDRQIDWSELPDHIIYLFATKLFHIKDYINFGGVCHSWHSVYVENRHSLPRQPPLLLLATELNNDDDQTRSFYSITEKRVLNFRVPLPHNRHCPGSSHGWLVTVGDDWEIALLNPFSPVNNKIHLPSATTFEHDQIHHPYSGTAVQFGNFLGYVAKVVLSANPTSSPNYVAMAIYSDFRRLAFCRPGDKVWTSLHWEITLAMDIIFYQDKFYFVTQLGEAFSCDLNHTHPKVSKIAPLHELSAHRTYLVESAGELLQVCRFTEMKFEDIENVDGRRCSDYFNEGFEVYKLDLVEHKWIKKNNLNGRVLFLGNNYSYSLSASEFTEYKPNSIYFTDDHYETYFEKEQIGLGPHDMGIFNLEDCTYEPHYPTKSRMIVPAPIWIEPML